MSITLTRQEIYDLAVFAGLEVRRPRETVIPLDEEYVICDCPADGLLDESPTDLTRYFHRHIVYVSEYPEEGASGLGPETAPRVSVDRSTERTAE